MSAMHHIFPPPRSEVVALQQDPDRFSTHMWDDLASDRILREQADRPPRRAGRRIGTRNGDDALIVGGREDFRCSGTRPTIDAIASDRPYGRGLSAEKIRSELVRMSGIHFDLAMLSILVWAGTIDSVVNLSCADPDKREVEEPTVTSTACVQVGCFGAFDVFL